MRVSPTSPSPYTALIQEVNDGVCQNRETASMYGLFYDLEQIFGDLKYGLRKTFAGMSETWPTKGGRCFLR